MEKYSWSFDGNAEIWSNSANSIEQCISEAMAQGGHGLHVYIGENIEFSTTVDATQILANISEQAYETCGEAAEDWVVYDHSSRTGIAEIDELSKILTDAVNAWLKKHQREPDFYSIENIDKYLLEV